MASFKKYIKGNRAKVTKYLWSTDFDCKCSYPECNSTVIDVDHAEKLQFLAEKTKRDITIIHGFRCEKWNREVGGTSQSRHIKGDATDIIVRDMTPEEVATECETLFTGIGRYDGMTHLDSRAGDNVRWDLRKNK